MDNTNNNTIGDNQDMNVNDMNTATTPVQSNDYNSMQPPTPPQVGDIVSDLTGMPAAPVSTAPIEEFPTPMDITTPVIDSPIPTIDTPVETAVIDSPMPTVETPIETPVMDIPMPTVETPIETSVMDTPMPTMETPVETSVMETAMPAMDTAVETPPMDLPTASVDTAPAFPTSVESSTSAPIPNQPLDQPMPSFAPEKPEVSIPEKKEEDIVNTLGEADAPKSGKGGTAVVIVLIVIIVALLGTIGYFALKIFG